MNSSIFAANGITLKGLLLPTSETVLFHDVKDKSFDPEKMEPIVKQAEDILGQSVPMLTLSLYRQFLKDGNRSKFEAPHHTRRGNAIYLALAEYYEKKGRFTELLSDYLWAMMEETTWVLPAHCHRVPCDFKPEETPIMDLYAANTSAVLATAYNLLKSELDEISPLICERIKQTVKERGTIPFLARDHSWFVSEKPNNWITAITANMLTAVSILEDDLDLRERVVNRACWALDRYAIGCPDDGGCDEGPGYWQGAGASMFDCFEILSDMTGGRLNLFRVPKLRLIGEYVANMHIDEKRYVNFSDCHPQFEIDGYMVERYGENSGSDMLRDFGRFINRDNICSVSFRTSYRTVKSLMMRKSLGEPKVKHSRKVWYPGHQVAVFRESEYGDEGLFLAAKGGNNAESHNHKDVGSFIVYSEGKPLLIDPGCAIYSKQYFSPLRYELHWNVRSGYHNLPAFAGTEQLKGKDGQAKVDFFDGESMRMGLDLTGVFPEESSLTDYHREFALSGGEVKVTERVRLSGKTDVDYHFMTKDEPRIAEGGVIELAYGRKLLYDASIFKASVETLYSEPGRIGLMGEWGTDRIYRITLHTECDALDTVFTVK